MNAIATNTCPRIFDALTAQRLTVILVVLILDDLKDLLTLRRRLLFDSLSRSEEGMRAMNSLRFKKFPELLYGSWLTFQGFHELIHKVVGYLVYDRVHCVRVVEYPQVGGGNDVAEPLLHGLYHVDGGANR